MSFVIDVHTHMLANEWRALLKQHGGPTNSVSPMPRLDQVIHSDGAPFMIPVPAMFDYDLRIKNRDWARVDIAVVSDPAASWRTRRRPCCSDTCGT